MTDLLAISLSASVPLRIMELEQLPRDEVFDNLLARREEWLNLIVTKADVLMYGGGKPGEVARVHTALTNALAHLAFLSGGVKFMGMHFMAGQEVVDGDT